MRRVSASIELWYFLGLAPKDLYVSRQAFTAGISVTTVVERRSLAAASADWRRDSEVESLGDGVMPSTAIKRAR